MFLETRAQLADLLLRVLLPFPQQPLNQVSGEIAQEGFGPPRPQSRPLHHDTISFEQGIVFGFVAKHRLIGPIELKIDALGQIPIDRGQ